MADGRRIHFHFASGDVVTAKFSDFCDSQLVKELDDDDDDDTGTDIDITLEASVVTKEEFLEWVLPFLGDTPMSLSRHPETAMRVLLLGQTLIMSRLVHWGAKSLADFIHGATREELVATFLDTSVREKRERE